VEKQSRRELLSKAAIALPLAAAGLTATSVAAAPKGTTSTTAFITSFVPGAGGFVGTLTVTNFQTTASGILAAAGTLSGNVLNGTGGVAGQVTQAVTVPVAVTASCEILTLTLGPLDLNLLGLVVHLNQVVLTINAVPGGGNLLGNLLCAVANLLNNPGALTNLLSNLVSLLNQILAAL